MKRSIENYNQSGKIYVSNAEKVLETFLSIIDLIKLSFVYKKDEQIKHDHNLINEEINLDEIKIVEFDHRDVVRHPLVSKIIRAYQMKSTDDQF